jgi:hypothetical protein
LENQIGDTVLEAGDVLTLLAPSATVEALSQGRMEPDQTAVHLQID